MAPRTRSAAGGRGRGRGRTRGGRTTQPSDSPPPRREETVPPTENPSNINITQMGDVLREFMTGFLATLARNATPQTQRESAEESEPIHVDPPHRTRATRTRVDPSTRVVPTNLEATPVVTPVVHVSDDHGNVEHGLSQISSFLEYRRDFNASQPPCFNGLAGPSEADSWLDHVEEELDNLCVPDGFRVKIAIGRLLDRARVWWRSTKSLYGEEALVWARFRTLFLEEYVSRAHREEKCKELDRLQQVGMTVQEYRLKFEELCIYKESFITHPNDKMAKFREGLKWQYQNQLSIIDPPNYKELVEAALRLDASVRYTEPLRNSQSLKRAHESDPSRSEVSNPQVKSYADRKRARGKKDRQARTSQDAPSSNEIVCYYCDEKGHMRSNCPKRLPPSDSHGAAREKGGVNPQVRGGHDGHANRSSTSHTQAQGSSRPGRVYALTQETRTPTALEGNFLICYRFTSLTCFAGVLHSFIASLVYV